MYRRRCYTIRGTSACDVTIRRRGCCIRKTRLGDSAAAAVFMARAGTHGTPGATRVVPRGVGITQQQHPAAGPVGPIGGRRGRGQRRTREPRAFTVGSPAAVARWPAALEYR